MYKILFICCLSLAFGIINKSASAYATNNKDTTLVITFEDYYKNDEINLDVNYKCIFKGEVVSSYKVGVTDVEVAFVKKNKSYIVCTYGNKYILIKNRPRLNLTVTLNGKISKFLIDLRLGKYLGLSKKDGNQFYLRQSKTPFFYD